MAPELKGRMPTSFSQEADGQLKNKNTVSIGHSRGKTAATSVHTIANIYILNPKPKQSIKLNRRGQWLSHSMTC